MRALCRCVCALSASLACPFHLILHCAQALVNAGANLEARTRQGVTPLLMAAEAGHTECVRWLLMAKADVNAYTSIGQSSIYVAASSNHVAVIEEILKARADTEIKDSFGKVPVFCVCVFLSCFVRVCFAPLYFVNMHKHTQTPTDNADRGCLPRQAPRSAAATGIQSQHQHQGRRPSGLPVFVSVCVILALAHTHRTR